MTFSEWDKTDEAIRLWNVVRRADIGETGVAGPVDEYANAAFDAGQRGANEALVRALREARAWLPSECFGRGKAELLAELKKIDAALEPFREVK